MNHIHSTSYIDEAIMTLSQTKELPIYLELMATDLFEDPLEQIGPFDPDHGNYVLRRLNLKGTGYCVSFYTVNTRNGKWPVAWEKIMYQEDFGWNSKISFEEVLENSPKDVQELLLFHLDLLR